MAVSIALARAFQPNPDFHVCFRSFHLTKKKSVLHLRDSPRLSYKSLSFPDSPTPSTSTSPDTAATLLPSEIYSQLEDSFRTGKFLTNEDISRLKVLQDYEFRQDFDSGSLSIRVMRQGELDDVVKLLSESFVESMVLPVGYVAVMQFLVKQYMTERRELLPHAVTLVACFKGEDEDVEELVGTVEVFLNKYAFNTAPQSPTPPKDAPLICNLSVKTTFRRKGIGRTLLKSGEELICVMNGGGTVYLHCRMIDSAPFNLYTKAGYEVVKTDSFMVLLMLQRRKYLMCKKLAKPESLDQDVHVSNIVFSL